MEAETVRKLVSRPQNHPQNVTAGKHPAAVAEAEGSSEAAVRLGAKIQGDLAAGRQGGKVQMQLLVMTGARSGGYRVGLTQGGPRNGGEDSESGLKGSPSLGLRSTLNDMNVDPSLLQIPQCKPIILG